MRFLLDVDGVVADLVSYLLQDLRIHFDNPMKYEEVGDLLTDFVSKEQRDHIVKILDKEGTAQKLPLIAGAQEGVQKILDAGHEIYWITSRWRSSKTWVYDRDQWLAKHFNVDPRDVGSLHHKFITHGDVFIDDKIGNVRKWLDDNPGKRGLLFSQPWNNKNQVFERFNGWEFIDELLESLDD